MIIPDTIPTQRKDFVYEGNFYEWSINHCRGLILFATNKRLHEQSWTRYLTL